RVILVYLPALFPYLLTIVQSRFIAMMPIRDVQLTLGEEILDKCNLLRIGKRMQAMLFIDLVGNLYLGVGSVCCEQPSYAALWIIIHAHDRAKIGCASAQQPQAIIFRLDVRRLVG